MHLRSYYSPEEPFWIFLNFSLTGFHLYPFKFPVFHAWDQSVLGILSEKLFSFYLAAVMTNPSAPNSFSLELFVTSKSGLCLFFLRIWHGIVLIFSLWIVWNLLSQSQGHIQICPENRIIMIIGKADVWEKNFLKFQGPTHLPNKWVRKEYASRFNTFGM